MFSRIVLIFILLTNVWIWKVSLLNVYVGILLVLTTISFYLVFKSKKFIALFLIFFGLLLFTQFQTTEIISLTNLDNDEQRVQSERLKEYPLIHFQIGKKVIWIKIGDFFEKNEKLIAFHRIESNFFENLDLNQYFFAGYPRQRIEIKEFEKFPYIYLPFFITGIYLVVKYKRKILLIFLVPFLILGFIGNKNILGPFSLFPLFVICIEMGLEKFLIYLNKNKYIRPGFVIPLTFVVIFIFFLQTIFYEFK